MAGDESAWMAGWLAQWWTGAGLPPHTSSYLHASPAHQLRIPLPTDAMHQTSLKRRYMLPIIIRCTYV